MSRHVTSSVVSQSPTAGGDAQGVNICVPFKIKTIMCFSGPVFATQSRQKPVSFTQCRHMGRDAETSAAGARGGYHDR